MPEWDKSKLLCFYPERNDVVRHSDNGTVRYEKYAVYFSNCPSGGMVDALDSKSSLVRGGSSSLPSGTTKQKNAPFWRFFCPISALIVNKCAHYRHTGK